MAGIDVTGFDPAGEPEISITRDGISVVFNFMPPSDMEDREEYFLSHFEQQMSEAIGLPVRWDDREVFQIPNPRPDTAQRLKDFLEGYRKVHLGT